MKGSSPKVENRCSRLSFAGTSFPLPAHPPGMVSSKRFFEMKLLPFCKGNIIRHQGHCQLSPATLRTPSPRKREMLCKLRSIRFSDSLVKRGTATSNSSQAPRSQHASDPSGYRGQEANAVLSVGGMLSLGHFCCCSMKLII